MSSEVTAVLDIGPSNGDSREGKRLEEKGGQKEVKPEKINEGEAEDGDEAQGGDTPMSGNCYHRCAVFTEPLCTYCLVPFNPMKYCDRSCLPSPVRFGASYPVRFSHGPVNSHRG